MKSPAHTRSSDWSFGQGSLDLRSRSFSWISGLSSVVPKWRPKAQGCLTGPCNQDHQIRLGEHGKHGTAPDMLQKMKRTCRMSCGRSGYAAIPNGQSQSVWHSGYFPKPIILTAHHQAGEHMRPQRGFPPHAAGSRTPALPRSANNRSIRGSPRASHHTARSDCSAPGRQ